MKNGAAKNKKIALYRHNTRFDKDLKPEIMEKHRGIQLRHNKCLYIGAVYCRRRHSDSYTVFDNVAVLPFSNLVVNTGPPRDRGIGVNGGVA